MIFEMLRWWYISGWIQAARRVKTWTMGVERAFSLSLLAKTLFAPWRRIVTMSGKSLDAQMRAMLDNLVSRCVGFFIRFFVIVGALVAMLGAVIASVSMAIIWPLLPVLIIVCVIKAVTG